MEYIFGFIIQIAGIMLLAKLSWSLCDWLLVKACARFDLYLFKSNGCSHQHQNVVQWQCLKLLVCPV
ncbi:hypothetical protein VCSRO206_1392 [Vibrio cholerae]|nr:hypothetical protein VCSRO206_1392 [Vibrio cholerae]